jgi:hypothetical protein
MLELHHYAMPAVARDALSGGPPISTLCGLLGKLFQRPLCHRWNRNSAAQDVSAESLEPYIAWFPLGPAGTTAPAMLAPALRQGAVPIFSGGRNCMLRRLFRHSVNCKAALYHRDAAVN